MDAGGLSQAWQQQCCTPKLQLSSYTVAAACHRKAQFFSNALKQEFTRYCAVHAALQCTSMAHCGRVSSAQFWDCICRLLVTQAVEQPLPCHACQPHCVVRLATPCVGQHLIKAGQLGGTLPLHPPRLQVLAPAGTHSNTAQPEFAFDLAEQCLVELAGLKFPALLHLDLSLNPALGFQRSRASGSSSGSRGHSPGSTTCSSLELVCRNFTQLTALDISGWNLAPPKATASRASSSYRSPWTVFAPLAQLRQLADLRAEGCHVVEWRGGPSSALQQLTSLSLSGNPLSSTGVAAVSFHVFRRHFCPGLADMAGLVRLDLSHCRFPYKLLRLLVSGLPASVADVALDGCASVTGGDLQVLALLPGLRRLSVSNMQPGLRDKHAEVLSRLASLRVLLLSGNDVGPKGVCVLLQGLTQLMVLDKQMLQSLQADGLPVQANAALASDQVHMFEAQYSGVQHCQSCCAATLGHSTANPAAPLQRY
ncbi:hypothetical protein COO60DRAFT_1464222 [Scenedesmus sp. NREL 46B-D3]|nr:hypothetical protein COO60DRAFT_1464222 [Scenedesmus sp. NREL 46B-D3]